MLKIKISKIRSTYFVFWNSMLTKFQLSTISIKVSKDKKKSRNFAPNDVTSEYSSFLS